jgi:hypothetical protein
MVAMQLLRHWVAAGYACVVIDLADRYSQFSIPGAWLSDPDAAKAPEAVELSLVDGSRLCSEELNEVFSERSRVHVVQFPHTSPARRSAAIVLTLTAIRVQRARTGRPHWLVIDDAESVVFDPAIPPHAMDLTESGHCLILRAGGELPGSLTGSIDVVVDERR